MSSKRWYLSKNCGKTAYLKTEEFKIVKSNYRKFLLIRNYKIDKIIKNNLSIPHNAILHHMYIKIPRSKEKELEKQLKHCQEIVVIGKIYEYGYGNGNINYAVKLEEIKTKPD